jgi:glycerophosphoryl diester phosphodiesterase
MERPVKTRTQLSLEGKTKPYVMAHRGNRVACPENTLAAFRRALADGADILETDLHLSADGNFVCIHDHTVDRTTDGSGSVASMTLSQLKALSAFYGRDEYKEERIPTLDELAANVPDNVALALELKSDAFLKADTCRQLTAVLDRTGVRNRTLLLSFSLPRLRSARAVASDIPIGWITLSRPWPRREVELLGPFWPWLMVNPLYVLWAHLLGQLVCPLDPMPDPRLWYYRLLGCDAVLSDDPGMTCRALGRPRSSKGS